jgi:hypothetical protein
MLDDLLQNHEAEPRGSAFQGRAFERGGFIEFVLLATG